MTIDDIDIVEISEPSPQVIRRLAASASTVQRQAARTAAARPGHPFGMTGARILCTLLNGLREKDKTYGLETMCVGGGQGMAMIVERLN
jgi:acetyl-CoA C-acetyltransferase